MIKSMTFSRISLSTFVQLHITFQGFLHILSMFHHWLCEVIVQVDFNLGIQCVHRQDFVQLLKYCCSHSDSVYDIGFSISFILQNTAKVCISSHIVESLVFNHQDTGTCSISIAPVFSAFILSLIFLSTSFRRWVNSCWHFWILPTMQYQWILGWSSLSDL